MYFAFARNLSAAIKRIRARLPRSLAAVEEEICRCYQKVDLYEVVKVMKGELQLT